MAEYHPEGLAGCLPLQSIGLPEYEATTTEAECGEMEIIPDN